VTTRRFAAAVALAAVGLAAAGADWGDPSRRGPVHPIVFPVLGAVSYTDTFGAPRGQRVHEGQDLMGRKMQPLLAAADGTVSFITIPEASYGYMLRITGDDGWTYSYLHINNDTPGTDDGAADLTDVFGPGIFKGARVNAGQVVAYMGDSGNAEETAPHLHFEMRDPTGALVNPYASLEAATRLAEPAPPAEQVPDLPRIAGADRVGTAVAASRAGWPAGAPAAVIASGAGFTEALPASVLAAAAGGPLLLTGSAGLPRAVGDELRRLGVRTVTVVGSVPTSVDAEVAAAGIEVTRVGGPDPAGTAAAVADLVGAADRTAVVVNATRFADAVSAAGLAAGRNWPILLADATGIPVATRDALVRLGVRRTYAVGGSVVLPERVLAELPGAVRLAGDDRYATSVAVAGEVGRLGGRSLARIYLATGANFPDALPAGALAARQRGVVLLVDGAGTGADAAVGRFVEAHRGEAALAAVLGGYAAVGPAATRTVASWFAT
jgi:putative cell wall-binding protein